MPLASDFRAALEGLPGEWADAQFVLELPNERDAERAAALMGAVNPARHGNNVRLRTARRGAGPAPDVVARALSRLDGERIRGELRFVSSESVPASAEPSHPRASAAAGWDAALATLPPDWSDIFAEVELRSSDYLERGALLLSPLNPARTGARAFRFRCARSFGYGAAAEVVRRCLERLDEEAIEGRVTIVGALSDTKPWATQGPVLYLGGKPV